MKSAQLAQLLVVAAAAFGVYSFARTARDGEARRVCTSLCALAPNYAGRNRLAPDFELPSLTGEKEKALPYIVLKGLKRAEVAKDFRDIQNAVDEATLEVLPKLANRMGYLTMLSSIATLMGLAGTIYGLILAFSAVGGDMPAAQKAQFLANGISAAMGTTILGLGVAIPIIVVQTIIQTKMGGITDEIDEHAVKLINLLTGYKPVS